jgi:LacI family transcriptional regulator
MENINIKRLASELKLSVSTVSKALRDSYEISAETKQRVFDMARKLNYVPNPYASSLRQKRSRTIGVVIPEVVDGFFSLVINGIESVAQAKGYHVLIYLTHESFEKEKAIIQDFQSGRVDGVLISLASETTSITHIENLHNNGVPVVFFDRVLEKADIARITTDDFESSYKATLHLIEQGCKQIAFLSISQNLLLSHQRLAGYQQALKDSQRTIQQEIIIHFENEADTNYSIIKNLLQSPAKPDGIVASAEKLAITSYLVCRELHLQIPSDIKIISFSNLETAFLLNPPLSTITQPAFEIGKVATTVLFKALDKKHFKASEESIILPAMFFARESSIAISNAVS